MTPRRLRARLSALRTWSPAPIAALALLSALAQPDFAQAAEPVKGIEQLLATAQQEKKGVTLVVAGTQIGGGVQRIEPGAWVEMKSQQYGRIVVRIDRIDAVLMP